MAKATIFNERVPVHTGWCKPTHEERTAALAIIKEQQGGLDPDFSKLAKAAIDAKDDNNPVFFWLAETQVLKKIIPVWDQGQIGSCVSHGTGRAVQYLLLFQIASGANEDWPGAEVCREAIYGGSRVQIGGGRLGGDGSVGAWAAQWMQKYGVVFYQKYPSVDLATGYDVGRCRSWGNSGCPKALEDVAKTHPVKTVAIVKTSDELWTAIGNGYPVAPCSGVGYTMSRGVDAFCARSGSWAHCMCFVGRYVHPSKGKCFIIQNSWGNYLRDSNDQLSVAGRTDRVQIPQGCFSVTAADADVMVREQDSFAYSSFTGFPSQNLDWFAMAPMPPKPHKIRDIFRMHRNNQDFFALAP